MGRPSNTRADFEAYMITLTFAGDESGDVSFAFGKGASRYFVVAVIATAEPDTLRRVLADVSKKSGLPAHYEFSFNKLSSTQLRRRVFQALAESSFERWATKTEDATLILDEFGATSKLPGELRRFMKLRDIQSKFKRVLARRSSSEPLIQVADLMAGAILRRDAKDDASAYETVEGKIKGLLEFRG